MLCHCRLGGDNSPFASDMDILWPTPCRLHSFDGLEKHGIILTKPDEGYNPEEDGYFDQFGGHLAFVFWIYSHAIVLRSMDVGNFFPMHRLEEVERCLDNALQNESQRKALIKAREDISNAYLQWRSEYGQQSEELKANIKKKKKGQVVRRQRSF